MGSDYIVMGRPLINALDPNNIIKKIERKQENVGFRGQGLEGVGG